MSDGKKHRHTGIKGELIRLLGQLPCDGPDPQMGGCPFRRHGICREVDKLDYCAVQAFADHLIANSVTIQKWIPVTERLPEDDTRVLVYLPDGYGGNEMIDTDRIHNGRWARWNKFITQWMPLPEPPKGEGL